MPARSADRATVFSRVLRVRTREPVFGPLPIGPQALQRPADRFITPTPRGHACSWPTWAARASVHTPVGVPYVRGD